MVRVKRCLRSTWGRGLVLLLPLMVALAVEAKPLRQHSEALAEVFPGTEITRRAVFLTDEQKAAVAGTLGEAPPHALVHVYEARRGDVLVGRAYLDSHRVRTLPETLCIALDASNRVVRVEVLVFKEPQDYLPRQHWYAQFQGRRQDAELQLGRGIHGVSGATLTARATTAAVRRVLVLDAVLHPVEAHE